MSVKQSQITKDQFHGDILQRDYSVHYDPDTKTYTFDFAEMKPETEQALKNLTYYRFSSDDISQVKQAISDYIAKVGPRVSRTPGEKGEITKTAEAQAEIYEKAEKTLENMQLKENLGEQLTNENIALEDAAKKEGMKLLKQKKLEELKQQRNAMNAQLEEGDEGVNETDQQLQTRLGVTQLTNELKKQRQKVFSGNKQIEYQRLTNLIENYEKVIALEAKPSLTPAEQAQKATAETFIQAKGEEIKEANLPKSSFEVSKKLEAKQKYSNARALISQLEGSAKQAKRKLTAEEQSKVDLAKADIEYYKSTLSSTLSPDELDRIEEQEETIRKATVSKYQALNQRLEANIRNYEARKANLKNNEKESLRKAQEARQAYATYIAPTSTNVQKTAAQATLDAAIQAELNMPNTKGLYNLPKNVEDKFGLQGGKRKTKKHKKQMKKNKTRKH